MKKLIPILFILTVLCISNAFPQWYAQPTPINESLNSIYVVNSNIAYVVGYYESILKTTNGGTNWVVQHHNTSGMELDAVWFTNETTGFAVGGRYSTTATGIIFKTTNGGINWESIVINDICFRAVQFLNSNTGFAGGWTQSLSNSPIYRTTNGGNNWIQMFPINSSGVEDFYFIDANTGWAVGDGSTNEIVIKTTNGGGDWSIISSSFSGTWLSSIFFVNANTGWITGNQSSPWGGLLRKTTDGGITWVQQANHNTNELYQSFFLNENTGWVVGDNPPIQKTTNGGLNWNTQITPAMTWCWDIYFADANKGWAVGDGSTFNILTSTNGGGPVFISNLNNDIPSSYHLYQNYPNPFNPVTKIKFDIQKSVVSGQNSIVTLKVFDLLGKEVASLVNEALKPGTYEVTFNGSNLSNGVYFYKLSAGNYIETKKMLMIK